MIKTEALLVLVNSLTKAEKKAFKIVSQRYKVIPGYLSLFNIICKKRDISVSELKKDFLLNNRKTSFDITVNYLYKILLDTLLDLRKEQDSYYLLFNSIMKARILFEKSLFEDCFNLLNKVIEDSIVYENFYALLVASKLELEYLLALNFPMMDEKLLLGKHNRVNEILSFIRKINQQSSLYELLKYRVSYFGNVRSDEQKLNLNDLVVSEISILASSNLENFEINKLHQLFQANYLISVGDYKSAIRSYIELNNLFEKNKHLWQNPPIYYLLTLEGVLDTLRTIRDYEGMKYFINQLKKIQSPSVNFTANVNCLIFLNELFPKLDQGNYALSAAHLLEKGEAVFNKLQLLSLTRQAELCLYTALIYFCNKDYKKAHKYLNTIILKGKDYHFLTLYRTIRLVNLMILNELGDYKLIETEGRSIKREIKGYIKGYQIEKLMLVYLGKLKQPLTNRNREILWNKVEGQLQKFRKDVFEQQVLKIFDFTAWIESKIRKLPLDEVVIRNMTGEG
jgi:hypothetical protein